MIGDDNIGGGTALTDNYWQITTTYQFDGGSAVPVYTTTIKYNGSIVVDEVGTDLIATTDTQYSFGGVTYTRETTESFSGLTTVQYAVTGETTSGGGGGGGSSYWYEPADYSSDGVKTVVINWVGDEVFNGLISEGAIQVEVGEYIYTRGSQTSTSMSSNKFYTVSRQSEINPVDLGDPTTIVDVSQGDYGIQILNANGNEVWGGGQRVISLVNEIGTVGITIPANVASATYELDLRSFGWTLTNRSVIDIYFRTSFINYTRTNNGVLITAQDEYGLTFNYARTINYTYYMLRF
jgi:hypothetical protein